MTDYPEGTILEIIAPNPGSDAAIAIGCTCPVLDNGHGRGHLGIKGLFWYSPSCPVHAKRAERELQA